jgi:outer membrane protein
MTQKIVLALMLCWSAFAAAEQKIGFVDMQKAIQDTEEGKKAKKELEADFNRKKKDLEKKEGDIKKMGEDLEKKALVLADDVKAKKQAEIQGEMRKYQEAVQKSQMDIQKHERDLTQPIIVKIRKIIEELAKKDGYSVVLEKSEQLVLYSVKEIDLTDRAVKEFNSKK